VYHGVFPRDTLAEKYFDDMNNDVQFSGKRHQKKSMEGFNRLPEIFTKEDVNQVFQYNNSKSVFKKIERLINEGLIVKITEGESCGKFKKKLSCYA
jgi:hypothetical protein